ncbi:hypothetical protein FGO68_gene4169 [Halteria grandinella]|uniref:TLDc domain-containing protein n=1 Tax=Halteria grandinella TaxID=5974 RepID=A0A8J8T1E6_HALGN|nr:hypothetical protein FGO68_gene4169 [Halteria grandinella]
MQTHLICQKCHRNFDLLTRKPTLTHCCHEALCLECWKACFKPSYDDQNVRVSQFACFYECPIQSGHPDLQDNPITSKVHMRMMEESDSLKALTNIPCTLRGHDYAQYYDMFQKKFLCSKCPTYNPGCAKINQDFLADWWGKVGPLLQAKINSLNDCKEMMQYFTAGQIQISSKDLDGYFSTCNDAVRDMLVTEEQKKILNDKDFGMITELIESYDEYKLIVDQLNKPRVAIRLLHRGSRDGYKGEDFRRNCYGHPNTLVVFESEKRQRFGGYMQRPWTIGMKYEEDYTSFLFSLSDKKIFARNGNYHAIGSKQLNMRGVFCWGTDDLVIYEDCDIESKNFSQIHNIQRLSFFQHGTLFHEEYAPESNKQYFKANEIEVFQLTFG